MTSIEIGKNIIIRQNFSYLKWKCVGYARMLLSNMMPYTMYMFNINFKISNLSILPDILSQV